MLKIKGVETYYGASQALFGITLSINRGEVVTLMGRNGMGKTTTVNSILGITPPKAGNIHFNNQNIRGMPSYKIAQLGIGLVPEGRQIFPNLTVRENLIATASNRSNHSNPWTMNKIMEIFPELRERLNNSSAVLSGGEQQMLAIGRALMTNPQLLILDEATEGLAPLVRNIIWDSLTRLKSQGLSILIIDKNLVELSKIADRHVIIEKGKDVWSGGSKQLTSSPEVTKRYLGI